MAVIKPGINRRKVKNMLHPKILLVAGLANILCYYTFDFILPFLKTNSLWVILFVAGIFGNAVTELIRG